MTTLADNRQQITKGNHAAGVHSSAVPLYQPALDSGGSNVKRMLHVRKLAASLLATLVMLGCGGVPNASVPFTAPVTTPPAPTVNPSVVARNIYVIDLGHSTVDVFAANLNGTAAPTASYAVDASAVTGDTAGNLYAAGFGTGSATVQVFAADSMSPSRSITVPNTLDPADNQILTMTADKAGNLYVAFRNVIYVFSPTATGAATPSRTLAGPLTTLSINITQMAVDSQGNLYVAEAATYPATQVVEFAPGATGNVAPQVVTAPTYFPTGVAVDSKDNFYISQGLGSCGGCGTYSPAIVEFPKGSIAGATPLRTIAGDKVGILIYANNLAIDAAGNIFLDVVLNGNSDFLVFAPGANGNVAPSSVLVPSQGSTTDSQFFLR